MLHWLFFSNEKEVKLMGKNLRGEEIGKGICQRKDGLYCARYVNKLGKRKDKYFKTVQEARNWLDDAKYEDKHNAFTPSDMTVNDWFEYWINHIVGDLAPNTKRNYRERHKQGYWRAGEPAKNATRAIESGMQLKLLQQLLGHASIKTTKDRFVHVTEKSLTNSVRQFKNYFSYKWRINYILKAENTDKSRSCR